MNDHVSNEMMATALGWLHRVVPKGPSKNGETVTLWHDNVHAFGVVTKPPDYIRDLNLVHEIENTLTDEEWGAYLYEIQHRLSPGGYPSALESLGRTWRHADAQTCCDAIFLILQARHDA